MLTLGVGLAEFKIDLKCSPHRFAWGGWFEGDCKAMFSILRLLRLWHRLLHFVRIAVEEDFGMEVQTEGSTLQLSLVVRYFPL